MRWLTRLFKRPKPSPLLFPPPEPGIGLWYRRKPADDPFVPMIYAKVLNVKNGYVQYVFDFGGGPWSLPNEDFLRMYEPCSPKRS